jgi:F-box interacting protein
MAEALDRSSVAGGTVLPPDAVYEILLRLPARTLCRFRAVCQSWLSQTTEPLFIAKYEARNRPEPLLLVANDGGEIHTMDLAGNVVKKVCNTRVTLAGPCGHIGPLCLVKTPPTVGVLDLAAGTVYASLPFDGSGPVTARRNDYRAGYALGRAATNGEHKVLRILHPDMDSRREQICDVLTLGGSSAWRRRPSPLVNVGPSFPIHDVVIDGVAYFLSDYIAATGNAHEPDSIASFDLEKEEWGSVTLRGPLSSHGLLDNADDIDDEDDYIDHRLDLGLAKVNGWLVTIWNQRRNDSSVDLWFLKDIEKGIWVKKFKIPKLRPMVPRPLMMLGDGRIVFSVEVASASRRALQACNDSTPNVMIVRTYDPITDESTDVARMEDKEIVGVYAGGRGSLLRPRNP